MAADPMFSNVQRQLTYVDQDARLQLVYETGQRPEERIATLGLVPRHRVDSREQVAEFFFLGHSRRLPSQLDTKSVPRRVRLAIERNIVVMSLDQTFQSGIQRENMYLRTVETTRPLPRRGLVRRELRLERYRSTGRYSLGMWQGKSWKVIICISRTTSKEPSGILNDTVYLVTWAWCLVHHHTDRFRGDTFRGAVRDTRGRECLARARSQTNGDRSQFGIQSLQIQQDAAAKTGPLDSEEFCHLLETLIQGEASQRLPDSTSVSTDMETGSSDRRIRLREERTDPPRHDPNASTDPESTVEPRGKVPRRAETSETEVPLPPCRRSDATST